VSSHTRTQRSQNRTVDSINLRDTLHTTHHTYRRL
jgi:hypothetical protein